jgi:antitoxin component of RelBE/YafQ-DinJ toxin-antitoxin module
MSLYNGIIGQRKNTMVWIRVPTEVKETFEKKIEPYNTNMSQMLRTFMDNINKGNLRIGDNMTSDISDIVKKSENEPRNIPPTQNQYAREPDPAYMVTSLKYTPNVHY